MLNGDPTTDYQWDLGHTFLICKVEVIIGSALWVKVRRRENVDTWLSA